MKKITDSDMNWYILSEVLDAVISKTNLIVSSHKRNEAPFYRVHEKEVLYIDDPILQFLTVNGLCHIMNQLERVYAKSLVTIWPINVRKLSLNDILNAINSSRKISLHSPMRLEKWYHEMIIIFTDYKFKNGIKLGKIKVDGYVGEISEYKQMKERVMNKLMN